MQTSPLCRDMASDEESEFTEAVVTCEGNLHDPDFSTKFQLIVDKLKSLLYKSKKEEIFKVRKIEPWNSVRVTISIPKEAAQRLRMLAQQGNNVLRQLGILSVQVEGDQVISLTLAGKNNEPQELLLAQSSSGTVVSSSTSLSIPSASSFLSSLVPNLSSSYSSSIQSPAHRPNQSVSSTHPSQFSFQSTDGVLPSQSQRSRDGFISPNVVAPTGESIPLLPKTGAGPPSRPLHGGPFPFASMTHAVHTLQRSDSLTSPTNTSGKSSIPASPTTPNFPSSQSAGSSGTHNNNPLRSTNGPPPVLQAHPQTLLLTRSDQTRFVYSSASSNVNSNSNNVSSGNGQTQTLSSSSSSSTSTSTSQSLQIQFVNVPPPTPPPYSVHQQQSLQFRLPQGQFQQANSTGGTVLTNVLLPSDKPVSSPLLVNLLQHGDNVSGNSSPGTPRPSSAAPQQSQSQTSAQMAQDARTSMPPPPLSISLALDNPKVKRYQLLQQQRTLKRGLSLDTQGSPMSPMSGDMSPVPHQSPTSHSEPASPIGTPVSNEISQHFNQQGSDPSVNSSNPSANLSSEGQGQGQVRQMTIYQQSGGNFRIVNQAQMSALQQSQQQYQAQGSLRPGTPFSQTQLPLHVQQQSQNQQMAQQQQQRIQMQNQMTSQGVALVNGPGPPASYSQPQQQPRYQFFQSQDNARMGQGQSYAVQLQRIQSSNMSQQQQQQLQQGISQQQLQQGISQQQLQGISQQQLQGISQQQLQHGISQQQHQGISQQQLQGISQHHEGISQQSQQQGVSQQIHQQGITFQHLQQQGPKQQHQGISQQQQQGISSQMHQVIFQQQLQQQGISQQQGVSQQQGISQQLQQQGQGISQQQQQQGNSQQQGISQGISQPQLQGIPQLQQQGISQQQQHQGTFQQQGISLQQQQQGISQQIQQGISQQIQQQGISQQIQQQGISQQIQQQGISQQIQQGISQQIQQQQQGISQQVQQQQQGISQQIQQQQQGISQQIQQQQGISQQIQQQQGISQQIQQGISQQIQQQQGISQQIQKQQQGISQQIQQQQGISQQIQQQQQGVSQQIQQQGISQQIQQHVISQQLQQQGNLQQRQGISQQHQQQGLSQQLQQQGIPQQQQQFIYQRQVMYQPNQTIMMQSQQQQIQNQQELLQNSQTGVQGHHRQQIVISQAQQSQFLQQNQQATAQTQQNMQLLIQNQQNATQSQQTSQSVFQNQQIGTPNKPNSQLLQNQQMTGQNESNSQILMQSQQNPQVSMQNPTQVQLDLQVWDQSSLSRLNSQEQSAQNQSQQDQRLQLATQLILQRMAREKEQLASTSTSGSTGLNRVIAQSQGQGQFRTFVPLTTASSSLSSNDVVVTASNTTTTTKVPTSATFVTPSAPPPRLISTMQRAILSSQNQNDEKNSATSQSGGKRIRKTGKPHPGGGKPRLLLINPLTGHLEPSGNEESSSESEEDEEEGRKGKGKGMRGKHLPRSKSKTEPPSAPGGKPLSVLSSLGKSTAFDSSRLRPTTPVTIQASPAGLQSVGAPISCAGPMGVSDSAPEVPSASSISSAGEKIKLRLKLEKSEPAYKVGVCYLKKSEKSSTSFFPGQVESDGSSCTSAYLPSTEQPRVPPLHISLRGKNSAVVVSPRRDEPTTYNPSIPPPPLTPKSGYPVLSTNSGDFSLMPQLSQFGGHLTPSFDQLQLNNTSKPTKGRKSSKVSSSRPKLSKESSSNSSAFPATPGTYTPGKIRLKSKSTNSASLDSNLETPLDIDRNDGASLNPKPKKKNSRRKSEVATPKGSFGLVPMSRSDISAHVREFLPEIQPKVTDVNVKSFEALSSPSVVMSKASMAIVNSDLLMPKVQSLPLPSHRNTELEKPIVLSQPITEPPEVQFKPAALLMHLKSDVFREKDQTNVIPQIPKVVEQLEAKLPEAKTETEVPTDGKLTKQSVRPIPDLLALIPKPLMSPSLLQKSSFSNNENVNVLNMESSSSRKDVVIPVGKERSLSELVDLSLPPLPSLSKETNFQSEHQNCTPLESETKEIVGMDESEETPKDHAEEMFIENMSLLVLPIIPSCKEEQTGNGNGGVAGEDSGIDSMDALSEKSPNQGESPIRKELESVFVPTCSEINPRPLEVHTVNSYQPLDMDTAPENQQDEPDVSQMKTEDKEISPDVSKKTTIIETGEPFEIVSQIQSHSVESIVVESSVTQLTEVESTQMRPELSTEDIVEITQVKLIDTAKPIEALMEVEQYPEPDSSLVDYGNHSLRIDNAETETETTATVVTLDVQEPETEPSQDGVPQTEPKESEVKPASRPNSSEVVEKELDGIENPMISLADISSVPSVEIPLLDTLLDLKDEEIVGEKELLGIELNNGSPKAEVEFIEPPVSNSLAQPCVENSSEELVKVTPADVYADEVPNEIMSEVSGIEADMPSEVSISMEDPSSTKILDADEDMTSMTKTEPEIPSSSLLIAEMSERVWNEVVQEDENMEITEKDEGETLGEVLSSEAKEITGETTNENPNVETEETIWKLETDTVGMELEITHESKMEENIESIVFEKVEEKVKQMDAEVKEDKEYKPTEKISHEMLEKEKIMMEFEKNQDEEIQIQETNLEGTKSKEDLVELIKIVEVPDIPNSEIAPKSEPKELKLEDFSKTKPISKMERLPSSITVALPDVSIVHTTVVSPSAVVTRIVTNPPTVTSTVSILTPIFTPVAPSSVSSPTAMAPPPLVLPSTITMDYNKPEATKVSVGEVLPQAKPIGSVHPMQKIKGKVSHTDIEQKSKLLSQTMNLQVTNSLEQVSPPLLKEALENPPIQPKIVGVNSEEIQHPMKTLEEVQSLNNSELPITLTASGEILNKLENITVSEVRSNYSVSEPSGLKIEEGICSPITKAVQHVSPILPQVQVTITETPSNTPTQRVIPVSFLPRFDAQSPTKQRFFVQSSSGVLSPLPNLVRPSQPGQSSGIIRPIPIPPLEFKPIMKVQPDEQAQQISNAGAASAATMGRGRLEAIISALGGKTTNEIHRHATNSQLPMQSIVDSHGNILNLNRIPGVGSVIQMSSANFSGSSGKHQNVISIPGGSSGTMITIPANLSHHLHSQHHSQSAITVLPSGHKVVPIKLLTLPKGAGSSIPLGGTNQSLQPNRSSPTIIDLSTRSSSPQIITTQRVASPRPIQTTPLNLSNVSGNIKLVPITANHAQLQKVLVSTSPVKSGNVLQMMMNSSQGQGQSQQQPTTIRVVRPGGGFVDFKREPTTGALTMSQQSLEQLQSEGALKTVPMSSFPLSPQPIQPIPVQPSDLVPVSVAQELCVEFNPPVPSPWSMCPEPEQVPEEGTDDEEDELEDDDFPFEGNIIHDEQDVAVAMASSQIHNNGHMVTENGLDTHDYMTISGATTDQSKAPDSPEFNFGTGESNISDSTSPSHSASVDIHGEDQEIIDSFSGNNYSHSEEEDEQNEAGELSMPESDHTYVGKLETTKSQRRMPKGSHNNLGELSIEIPTAGSVEQEERSSGEDSSRNQGISTSRNTRSNTRIVSVSPDITALTTTRTDSPKLPPPNTKFSRELRNSPKPSPTGSSKLQSPVLAYSPLPTLNSHHFPESASSPLPTTIQGKSSGKNNKRKRRGSDSSSASKEENGDEGQKAEVIDLNARPGKRRCSENAAELIKACIGAEDTPKRNSLLIKRLEDAKAKEAKAKKSMMVAVEETDDELDSMEFGLRGRGGRSSRGSSEDRSSSRGSSVNRHSLSSKTQQKDEEKDNKPNSRTNHRNATAGKKSGKSNVVAETQNSLNSDKRKNERTKAVRKTTGNKGSTVLSTGKSRSVNIKKEQIVGTEKLSTSTTNPENENLRRKTRSSAAVGSGTDNESSAAKRRRISKDTKS